MEPQCLCVYGGRDATLQADKEAVRQKSTCHIQGEVWLDCREMVNLRSSQSMLSSTDHAKDLAFYLIYAISYGCENFRQKKND